MRKSRVFQKKKILVIFLLCCAIAVVLFFRLFYLMVICSEEYYEKAQELHERERKIKAARGEILDRNGKVLASNRTVCTVSVIHNQIKNPEQVIRKLSEILKIEEDIVRKRVEKVSSIERIKTNISKEEGDKIRSLHLDGVKVDEDYKRYYPYGSLASKVLGFTGSDNQGIVGLEVKYDDILSGTGGKIYTITDARGVELEKLGERRQEPAAGNNLRISLHADIQQYVQQAAEKVMEEKEAEKVCIILMDPQNGEIYAMVNVPEFDLNHPFSIPEQWKTSEINVEEMQNLCNQMWRNSCLNDTYEPGSTFKIITMSAGIEESIVSVNDSFYCPGYKLVGDRRIHCANRNGHGAETFLVGAENSCNPVFIEVGQRLGVDRFYHYFQQFGLMKSTGIDLPGEAATIMHKKENMGEVELATVSFGQSFQITPIQLAATVSSLINGGRRIVPHFGVTVENQDGTIVRELEYQTESGIVSEKTSETVRYILEHVVSEGSGKNAKLDGYSIGGKTATSQTLPRSANRYISSFLGFAPADHPQILGLCIIYDPKGVYYGGTIAAPVMQDLFKNILPVLNIQKSEIDQQLQ